MSSPDSVAAVGLCLSCRHVYVVPARTGQRYYRCERSSTDERYPKYPRLPVRRCEGYDPRGAPAADEPLRAEPDGSAGAATPLGRRPDAR